MRVLLALHQLLLQIHESMIELFPAVPTTWDHAAFRNLLGGGFTVSAEYTRTAITWTSHSVASTLRKLRKKTSIITSAVTGTGTFPLITYSDPAIGGAPSRTWWSTSR